MAVQSVYLCWAQSSKFKNSKLIIDSVGFKKSTLNQLLELHFERGLGDGLHSKASSIALKGDILWDVDRQSLLYLCAGCPTFMLPLHERVYLQVVYHITFTQESK